MIKKVIHVADIHIPNNEDARPFSKMLKQFLADVLKEVQKCERDEVRIVIVGDIFDQKIKVTNEARSMFHEMLRYLDQIAKTYIIKGNHDMLENNKDRMDSLKPTFDIIQDSMDIQYLDMMLDFKSGYCIDDNIIWALYSIHDNFATPNIDGLKEEYPDKTIVGLYHGEVPGAKTDTGRMSETGIDPKEFKGCDCVMAGHIHKFQTIKKGGIPIVYASSLFQKDAGENTTGHGFVVWDMEKLKYKLHEVKNNYLTYKFKISSYEDVKNDEEKLLNL